jgi:hypothetical protein
MAHWIPLVTTAFWLWMLIHCLSNTRMREGKILWFIFIFFTNVFGAAIYFTRWVLPSWISSFGSQAQASQQKTPYYQPSQSQTPLYQPYQQGYQPQPVYYQPTPTPPAASIAQEEQGVETAEYEQPQAMYPEMPQ